jgi:hypothetical protein
MHARTSALNAATTRTNSRTSSFSSSSRVRPRRGTVLVLRASSSSSKSVRPRRGTVLVLRASSSSSSSDDDDDDDDKMKPPFQLPKALWTNKTDSKSPEEKCSEIYQSYITMAATRVIMAQDDGFGNECSEDVNVSETTSKILTHKEKHSMLSGTMFLKSMMEAEDPILRSAALRIIETRRVYASDENFGLDWESSFKFAKDDMERWRVEMLKRVAEKSLRGEKGE